MSIRQFRPTFGLGRKKSSSKALLPTAHCPQYIPRTGAFAYLDRCARCNAREESHRSQPEVLTPRFRQAREQPWWLIRDVASDSGWAIRSRVCVIRDAARALKALHEAGYSYGPTLRATAVMVGEDGAGGLRRPVPMSLKMDRYDSRHETRCREDMLRFGKILNLVLDDRILQDNGSLTALRDQLLSEDAENRPDAESTEGWLDSVLQDLGGEPEAPPKFASSRHPFYGYIDLVTKESLENDDLDGYDSDDSFLPAGRAESDREDEGESSTNLSNDDSASEQEEGRERTGSFSSKLNSFLTEHGSAFLQDAMPLRRRSASDDMSSPETDAGKDSSMLDGLLSARATTRRRPTSGKFRPLSSATKSDFRKSWDKRQTRKMSVVVPSPKQVAIKFDKQERLSEEEASALISQAEQVLRREDNVLEINDSKAVQIFGDIHGQYFDLRFALQESGYSLDDEIDEPSRTLVFLGDYVDRGAWSCEVLFFVLALKVARPSRVFLLRGNHECGAVVSYFGFKDEMETKYGLSLFHRSIACFQAMPLCAVVSTAQTKWMLCHGGISPKLSTLEDVRAVNRFAEPGMNGLFCDLLWADPLLEKDLDHNHPPHVEFVSNPSRGCSVRFGRDALVKFLDANQLNGLIRGHEVMEDGVAFQYDQKVVTVFSAPNYCGRYGNRAAYLMVEHEGADPLKVFRYDPAPNQPEPATFDSVSMEISSGIASSLPFMPTTLSGFVNRALQLWTATAIKEAQEELLSRQQQVAATDGGEMASSDASQTTFKGGDETNKSSDHSESPRASRESVDDEDTDEDDDDDDNDEEDNEGGDVEDGSNDKGQAGEDASSRPEDAAGKTRKGRKKKKPSANNDEGIKSDRPPVSPFNKAKRKLSRALQKMATLSALSSRFQTAKYSDGINEAHPSLTQFKIQSAELLLRMRSKASEANILAAAAAEEDGGAEGSAPPKRMSDLSQTPVGDIHAHHLQHPHEGGAMFSTGDQSAPIALGKSRTSDLSMNRKRVSFSSPSGAALLTTDDLPPHHRKSVSDGDVFKGPLDLGESAVPLTAEDARTTPAAAVNQAVSSEDEEEAEEVVVQSFSPHHKLGSLDDSALLDANLSLDSVDDSFSSSVAAGTPISKHAFDVNTSMESLSSSSFSPAYVSFSPRTSGLLLSSSSGVTTPGGSNPHVWSPRAPFGHVSSFSESELRNLQLLFLLVDRTDDGKISHEEIVAWSLDEGERVSEEDAKRVVEAVDADQDGSIGLDDWLWFAHCCRELWLEENSDQAKHASSSTTGGAQHGVIASAAAAAAVAEGEEEQLLAKAAQPSSGKDLSEVPDV